jgi:hypothetical protein
LDNVLSGRTRTRVLLIIREDHHIFSFISIPLDEEIRDILDVVDATVKFTILVEIVDPDEETFLPAITLRILEIGLHISVTVPLEVRTIVLNLSRWHRRRSGRRVVILGRRIIVIILSRITTVRLLSILFTRESPVGRWGTRRRSIS